MRYTIASYLAHATQQLHDANIDSAQLDASVIVAHNMHVDRAWLIVHGDEELESLKVRKFESLLRRRLDREPIAYIVGHKEFYGRDFTVTPDVLIPRPETETMIEMIKKIHHITEEKSHEKDNPFHKGKKLLDVGCGSGCIGITAKLEMPELDVTMCDISKPALAIARKNSEKLHAEVTIARSDLLCAFLSPSKIQNPKSKIYFDAILANLPYVDRTWQTSPELRHEPGVALYAGEQGLQLIKTLISQAPSVLAPHGYVLLEADPCQHEQIVEYGKLHGFTSVEVKDYIEKKKKIVHRS